MELKFGGDDYYVVLKRFQSYLYGIEIRHVSMGVKRQRSFNRTFMELK